MVPSSTRRRLVALVSVLALIDVVDKTLTDEMIALVPADVGADQLATIVAPNARQLSATCPAAAQAF